MTQAELEAKIKQLEAENEAKTAEINSLKSSTTRNSLSLRVSKKKAVSVYGLGKWPDTKYAPQWLRLLDIADEIKAFIEANKALLSWDKNADKAENPEA